MILAACAPQEGDDRTEHEAADVRDPRDAFVGVHEELADEPEQQKPSRANLGEEDEEPEEQQRSDADVREPDEIRAHHTGDGARRADDGHRAVWLRGDVGTGRHDTRDEIEREIGE